MTDQEQKRIFSNNLNSMLRQNRKTQKEVADALGILPQTFNSWCQGVSLPRMGKVQLLADFFGIQMSDLIDNKTTAPASPAPAAPQELSDDKKELLRGYDRLNDRGKREAVKRVKELSAIPDYTEKETVVNIA